MDPGYAAAYRELYEHHWWWRARERFLLDRLSAQAAGRSDLRILDVGCGDALFFDRLSEFGTVHGVEPDVDLLSDGPWRSWIHAGTLETFEAEEPYDWILMLDVLEHLAEPSRALGLARSMATRDAALFVTVPAFQSLWTHHDELNHHYRRYDKESLTSVVSGSAWHVEEATYFFHWLAPLKLLIRLKEVVTPDRPGIETMPSKAINQAAQIISTVEQRVTSSVQVPFGTSLYARCQPGASFDSVASGDW